MTLTEADVSGEVREWFHAAWDPNATLIEWRTQLLQSGWAVPSWTTDWFGRGLPAWADGVVKRTIVEEGGVGLSPGAGRTLMAPTVYEHGSDELKAQVLRPALTGEQTWCQLFSEPGAGSDLAGLKTTAILDGEEWIVSGQKVWNTSADHADMAILVARTDWDAVKHAGLTYFVIDMHQDAVEVRPIEQMNYHQSFTEVFMTEAVVPVSNVVGEVGGGWAVARATLNHERRYGREPAHIALHATGRTADDYRTEWEAYNRTYVWYPQRRGRPDLIIDRARAMGVLDDPVIRDRLMDLHCFERAAEWTAQRARVARELGRPPGAEGSIGKLATSEVARRSNALHSSISGARAMLKETEDPIDAVIAEVLVSTPAQSIAGGTDQIQKNILGESILSLPKEPAADRGMPYRDVGRA